MNKIKATNNRLKPWKKGLYILFLLAGCLVSLLAAPCGDVNTSGGIDIVDALMTAQHYVGLNPAGFDQAAADVNGDGAVTIIDALQLAQYYVGLISVLQGCAAHTATPTPPDVTSPPVPLDVKPRVIATTDGEVDDRCSMLRFLMYACDYDVAGIIRVGSRWAKRETNITEWIEKEIDLYEQVYSNLIVHNPNYPPAAYLRSIVKVGNVNSSDLYTAPPNMSVKDTAGSQLIIDTLLDNDPRPVHVLSWGGANTTAYALYKLKTAYSKADYDKAVAKIRMYCIWYQDGGGQWIEDNIPGALINEAYRWDNVWDYQSTSGPNPPEVRQYMTGSWLNTNVKQDHGPLGAYTPQSYVSEGETPSFLHLVNNGLRAHEDYTLGGWGGRSIFDNPSKPKHMTDSTISDDGDRNKMYWRWVIDAENDFAARMDWCVATSYSGANHAPIANLNGSYTVVPGGLGRTVTPGQTIILDASPSTDPDGNSLSFLWWQYYDADSAAATLSIADNTSRNNASFTVPNEAGKQIHIILEVNDNGTPPLKGYQRLIFTIN